MCNVGLEKKIDPLAILKKESEPNSIAIDFE